MAQDAVPSDDAVQDLGVKLTDLAFMISPLAFNTVRENLAKPFDHLALPCANLRAPLLGSPIVGTDYESWVWRLAVC